MVHPLVTQLRFTRGEFKRAIEGVSDPESQRRFLPMNCLSWNVGHLAWQEQRYFVAGPQGRMPFPDIDKDFAYGAPASTPPMEKVFSAWTAITQAADPWLDTLDSDLMESHVVLNGKPSRYIYGSLLLRVIYHYWYHTGENMAIRQMLGQTDLPEFVGDVDRQAPYRPDPPDSA